MPMAIGNPRVFEVGIGTGIGTGFPNKPKNVYMQTSWLFGGDLPLSLLEMMAGKVNAKLRGLISWELAKKVRV